MPGGRRGAAAVRRVLSYGGGICLSEGAEDGAGMRTGRDGNGAGDRPMRGGRRGRAHRAPRTAAALLFAALAVLVAPAGAAPQAAREDWRKVEAGEVTVVGTASEARLRETAATLRALVTLLPDLAPGAFGPLPPVVAAVVLEPARLAEVGVPPSPPPLDRIVLVSAGDEASREGLLRAAAVALVRRGAPAAPPWVPAGLGEYLSTIAAAPSRATLGRPVAGHAALLRADRSPSGPFLAPAFEGDDAAGALARAEAWAVVHYLLHAAPEGAARLGRFVALCSAGGTDPQAALREAFGVDGRSLFALARAWATEARPLARWVPIPEGVSAVGRVLPLTRAGAAAVLGGAVRTRSLPAAGPPPAPPPRPTAPPRPAGGPGPDVAAEVDRVNRLVDAGREEEALARLEALHASLGHDPEMQGALGWDVAEVRRVVVHNRLVRRYNEAIGLLNAGRTAEAVAIFREVFEAAEDPGLRRLAWERATAPAGGRR